MTAFANEPARLKSAFHRGGLLSDAQARERSLPRRPTALAGPVNNPDALPTLADRISQRIRHTQHSLWLLA